VAGKRLLWFSIIILELALVYFLWRPYRDHFRPAAHRVASVPRLAPRVEANKSPFVVESRKPVEASGSHGKPSAIRRDRGRRAVPPVVSAGLKVREPIVVKPLTASPAALSPLESFWCHISMIDSNCNCKGNGEEQAAILVTR